MSVAEMVFGVWQVVTVQTALQPVPEWVYENRALGSVTTEYRQKVESARCDIYDSDGRVVGFSLSCGAQK